MLNLCCPAKDTTPLGVRCFVAGRKGDGIPARPCCLAGGTWTESVLKSKEKVAEGESNRQSHSSQAGTLATELRWMLMNLCFLYGIYRVQEYRLMMMLVRIAPTDNNGVACIFPQGLGCCSIPSNLGEHLGGVTSQLGMAPRGSAPWGHPSLLGHTPSVLPSLGGMSKIPCLSAKCKQCYNACREDINAEPQILTQVNLSHPSRVPVRYAIVIWPSFEKEDFCIDPKSWM